MKNLKELSIGYLEDEEHESPEIFGDSFFNSVAEKTYLISLNLCSINISSTYLRFQGIFTHLGNLKSLHLCKFSLISADIKGLRDAVFYCLMTNCPKLTRLHLFNLDEINGQFIWKNKKL